LTVQPEPGIDDIERATVLVRGIERVLRDAQSAESIGGLLDGKRLFAVGRPVSYVYAFDTVYRDIRRIALAATLVVIALLALFFRRPLAPFVLLLPIATGFALAAAIGYLLFGSMSLIAWIFVGVLVGLGVDFGLHVTTHYWIYGEPCDGRADALSSALLRPGRGIIFGGLTSAAAFFSLQIVSYPVMREVAWLTGIGLLAILASSFTVLPIGLSYFPASGQEKTRWSKWCEFFDRASRTSLLRGSAPWIVLIAASLFAARSIPFEPHPWKLALRGNPKSAELERLNNELGSAFTPLLMVSQGRTVDEAIARDRQATHMLQRVALKAGVTSIESPSRWLPARENQVANIEFIRDNRELFSAARFRRDFQDVVSMMDAPDPYLTEEYLPLVTRFLRPDQREFNLDDLRGLGLDSEIDRHLVSQGGQHLAISYIYLRKFPWAEGSVSRFLEVFDAAGRSDLTGVQILGEALRSASHASILRRDALLATLLALALVAAVLWVAFRDFAAAALCLLPLACGVSAALLVMAVFNVELNMLTLAIAPLLVGIGVDDGIHMVERLQTGEEVGNVVREAGSAMTMTTLTTVAAFACLGLATFDGMRDIGLVGAVGIFVCLLASLHLIPLFYRHQARASLGGGQTR
jgi:predicted RND superfamily exporter protein